MSGLCIGILLLITIGHIKAYKTPTPKVELLENGFRISIPGNVYLPSVRNPNRKKIHTYIHSCFDLIKQFHRECMYIIN